MAKVTYIGTPDDPTGEITHGGVTFKRGDAVTVTAEQMKAGGFDTNPTFATDAADVKAAADADDVAERNRLVASLKGMDVEADGRWSITRLREANDAALLAKAKA